MLKSSRSLREDQDYDDTPLFTREPSYKRIKPDNVKSACAIIPSVSCEVIKHCASHLESSLFASILEDVLIQLRLLDECNNPLRIYKAYSDMQELRRHKYGVMLQQSDELTKMDPSHFNDEYHKLDKLVVDRNFCKDVLTSTYLGLALNRSYAAMVETRLACEEQKTYYDLLVQEESRNRMARREAAKLLRQQRNRMKSVVYENDLIVTRLTNAVEDAAVIKETRERYIGTWQNARAEQHAYRIQMKEAAPSEATTIYRKKMEDEQRIHSEVEFHNTVRLNEILQEVDVCMAKYDKDIEAIEIKIQIQHVDLDAQIEIKEELEKRLEEHAKDIQNWISFKEEREILRQYNEKMTAAAIAVQSWWRGLLVRLALGPFMQKKKPPPKKNKKK